MVKKNNGYLKDIVDKVGGDSDGVHTDNYYLKQISENITGGGGGGDITVDSELSTTSTNPVQNKVITTALNSKADDSDIPSDIDDLNPSTATFTITYTDDSTEDVEVVIIPNNSSGA